MINESISKYDLFLSKSCRTKDDIKNITIEYDLFISAFTKESMVHDIFNEVEANKKIWVILPDYKLIANDLNEIKQDECFKLDVDITSDELEMNFITQFCQKYNIEAYKDKKVCIDITGFVKPYMIYLLYSLINSGFNKMDILYSEPKSYKNQEETTFSDEEFISVRSINGFDIRSDEAKDDLLIINAGYDYRLMRNIASYKKYVKAKTILIGFPSLQPIMYQENILNLEKASDELGLTADTFKPLYAPANDPFETAKAINNHVLAHIENHDVKTIYLAPLATKSQTLGMLLFFLYERKYFLEKHIDIKIIYPFTGAYSPSSGKELFRVNLYQLEI